MIDDSINLLPTSPVRFSKKIMAAVFETVSVKYVLGNVLTQFLAESQMKRSTLLHNVKLEPKMRR